LVTAFDDDEGPEEEDDVDLDDASPLPNDVSRPANNMAAGMPCRLILALVWR